ncbi:Bcr/CflA family efflux MFS transporter [Aurantiacibacter poecillastricola]|uniref:Bcr/CflA family efflux MFS transporter n=1 Tax=Aurantiacibacter poecillastricola TaxID=3064385 RepID=UPI00273EA770|nr:Bcr/CflA family efflux MFS transporter [Aurantiacibacter sp. 219JJ12-13]MDP5261296.1 Bcr/CflA family efflux MFS transporter [Aurantiacibacter sp. 219JJ12-13]
MRSRPGFTILILGLISALGSMAIHMLAPALPLVQRDLSASVAQAQLIITIYLFGLGGGQLLMGPLVDRWGRIKMLVTGLVLFVAGSLASAFAAGLEMLLAARALQAVGGAAGLVCSRALVADLFGSKGGAREQAKLMMVVLISPALAPLVGAYLASWGGWRLVFVILASIAVAAFILALRFLRPSRETSPPQREKSSLFSDLARLARNRSFVLSTCALAAGSSALYMFLASGAFLLEQRFGLDERSAGLCFLLVAAAGIIGTRLVQVIERRKDSMVSGSMLLLTGSLLLLLTAFAGITGPLVVTLCMMVLGLGAGVVGPSAIHNAVSAEIGLAGTGASIAGSVQMLVSGAATIPLGWLGPITATKLGLVLSVATSLSLTAAVFRARYARFAAPQADAK